MANGTVVDLFYTPKAGGAMQGARELRAVEGKGLEGDRYCDARGTFSKTPGGGRQVTLIETEAIEAAGRDYGVALEPARARRNILTRGVALNHLVGREFRVGEVRLRGIRLCEPCKHLESLSEAGVLEALVHRGGLRADVVRGGVIRPGDPIEPV